MTDNKKGYRRQNEKKDTFTETSSTGVHQSVE